MKKPRAKQRGTSNRFEVFRVSLRRPSCLAVYFAWPQVALTHHVFIAAYTLHAGALSSFDNGTGPRECVLFFLSRWLPSQYDRIEWSKQVQCLQSLTSI